LKLEAWSGASTPRPFVPMQGTQTGEAVQRGEAAILDLNDPRFLQTDIPINSMICVPMIGRDGVLGCLNVATGGKQFLDISDLKRLQTIINPVSVAFENARLYETLEQRTLDLERMGREAQHVALHDHLTGLPNRRAFDAGMRQRLEQPTTFCLAVIDLVGFKKINDQLGHVSGDITLIRIADVLRSTLNISEVPILKDNEPLPASTCDQTGCAYRVGGDEFHLLLPFDRSHATQMIHALIEQVQALEIEGEGVSLPVGLNVGLAEYPLEAGTLDQLQSLADDRMYAAKRTHIPMLEWSS
jgi:GGDEF domain-containing protein